MTITRTALLWPSLFLILGQGSLAQHIYEQGQNLCVDGVTINRLEGGSIGAKVNPRSQWCVNDLGKEAAFSAIQVIQTNQIAGLLTQSLSAEAASNAKLDGVVNAISDLKASVKEQISVQQKQMLESMRSELLTRIEQLPFELARDGDAYNVLRQRLEQDLTEVFERKSSDKSP